MHDIEIINDVQRGINIARYNEYCSKFCIILLVLFVLYQIMYKTKSYIVIQTFVLYCSAYPVHQCVSNAPTRYRLTLYRI